MSESNSTDKKITIPWNAAILITLIVYGITTIWWLAKLDSRVEEQASDIIELQQGSSVLISREQLSDLLGGRDERLSNVEKSLIRIENKLEEIR